MFKSKQLKLELKALKDTVEEMMSEIAGLKEDYNGYLEWKKMRDANEEAAAKMGHFYISADDLAMLERFIQSVNKDPDLAVLMTTPQGTTMSLRSHPQPKLNSSSVNYSRYATEEE